MNVLSAFKDASVELEVQKEIISHMVLVVLKNLFLVDERTNTSAGSSLTQSFCTTAAQYFIRVYENESFWLEFSLAMFLDPRQRKLQELKAFWSEGVQHTVVCLQCYTFDEWVEKVHATLLEYMRLVAV